MVDPILKDSAVTFLKALYRNCDQGFINLRFLPSGANLFVPLPRIDTIPSLLETHKGENAYFGVATRKNGDGTKQGIIQIPALWLDMDLKEFTNEEWKKLEINLDGFPLNPSYIIGSGGGFHIYWQLKEPAFQEGIPQVEDVLRRLATYFGGDKSATDASRILRIPGTLNYKYNPPRQITARMAVGHEYNLPDFDFLPPIETITMDEKAAPLKSWERELLGGVAEGLRNTAITRLSGRYVGKGLSRQEILPILLDANSRFKPPLFREEIERTLDSVIKTHFRNPPNKIEEKERGSRRINYRLTTLDDVFEYPEPTYLIDPVLIETTVSILGAFTGTGKSITALSIMKSLLTGEPLWGKYPVAKTGPVLLVDEETPQSFLRERTSKMGFTRGLPLYFLHFQDVRLDRDDYFNALMEKIEEVKPILVVIDSLIRVHRAKEDDSSQMSQVIGRLRKIANTGTTVLAIHHHRKGEGPLAHKLRGSSDIPGGVDIEYALLPKDDYLIFTSVKTRTQPLAPIKLKMEVDEESMSITYMGVEVGEEGEVMAEVIYILQENGQQGVEEILKALKERGIKLGINRLRSLLKKESGKELLEERGPKGKRLYTVNPAS